MSDFTLEVQYPKPSKAEQDALDAYDTPEPLARASCWALRRDTLVSYPDRILIPSAGTGAFLRAAREVWPRSQVVAMDIAPRGPDVVQQDFLKYEPFGEAYDLVIDNPPWSLADEFVAHALRMVRTYGSVVYLLRTSFWGGQDRVDRVFREPNLRYWMPLRERPDYTGEGGDSSDSSVFVWQRGYEGRAEVVQHLHWRGGRG